VELTPRPRFRLTPRVIAFGAVALALLGMAVFVIFQAGTYAPNLPSDCFNKRSPDPLYPVPWIVVASVIAFVAGGVASRLRARSGNRR
jgi:hypothetical protein